MLWSLDKTKLALQIIEGFGGIYRPLKDVYHVLGKELSDAWIFGLNIYPCTVKSIIENLGHALEQRGNRYQVSNVYEFNENMDSI